uniref:Uncharacterized protein n=1 Tax=Gouania willdenowi TaxID=441366 RepID=A0A8C5GZM1_GOUWI
MCRTVHRTVTLFPSLLTLTLSCLFRRTSYGPLLDSSDFSSVGNFSNPMYDP